MSKAYPAIGVLGGGSWGTALAVIANRAGGKVMLGTRNPNVINAVTEKRVNDVYLPEVFIDPAITVTDDLAQVCTADILIIAVPSHCMRSACIMISDLLPPQVPVVVGSKGIEQGSLLLMTEVVASVLPGNTVAVLSGPNFATEAAIGKPTATTIACTNPYVGNQLLYALGGKLFRPYLTEDVIGTQIGGATKNVIAIACGIAHGMGLGENARAALITRGFAEMSRLCLSKGGRYETLMGLSGLGDLMLTCSSVRSRNTAFGVALSKGVSTAEALVNEGRGVIEGAKTADSVLKLAHKYAIDMPICEAVHRVLSEEVNISDTINTLLDRPFTRERTV